MLLRYQREHCWLEGPKSSLLVKAVIRCRWVRTIGGKILGREIRCTRKKTSVLVGPPQILPTWIGPRSNPGLWGYNPMTSRSAVQRRELYYQIYKFSFCDTQINSGGLSSWLFNWQRGNHLSGINWPGREADQMYPHSVTCFYGVQNG